MATILAHIRIHPGREAEFETLSRTLYAATGDEEGRLSYQYWRAQEPGLYYCLLAFTDFNAFITHQTSDHHEAASPKLQEMIADIKLEWVDPVAGAAEFPPTDMQPLPEGADALRTKYHELFAAQIADWWAQQR